MSFTTVSERLAAVSDALRELVQALGPCGSIDKKGNCGNHFATCPCPVGEADLLLEKMRETEPEPERIGSADVLRQARHYLNEALGILEKYKDWNESGKQYAVDCAVRNCDEAWKRVNFVLSDASQSNTGNLTATETKEV